MLPVLAAGLFIFYMHKRNFLEKTGFGKAEVGMILVGSLFGMIADIPLIVSDESLLNINVGGGLIPVIVAGSLVYKKKINLYTLALATGIVSAVAFLITDFRPSMGIVAEFPQFLLPSFLGIVFAFVFEREAEMRIPFAYTAAVMGNLIGADLVRIPMLVDEGVLGSIGGAGAMDLVYLSGLIAAVPLIAFYYNSYPDGVHGSLLDDSINFMRDGRFIKSVISSQKAVDRNIKKGWNLMKMRGDMALGQRFSPEMVMSYLGFHKYAIEDYKTMNRRGYRPTKKDAHKVFVTARFLTASINEKLNKYFHSLSKRIIAYLIDLLLIFVPFVLILIFVFLRNTIITDMIQSYSYLLAIFSLMISIQFIYFTLLEWKFGASLGKKLMGLKVVSDDMEAITFVQSAARNTARYADIILYFYIFSIVLMVSGGKNKRIGDYVAGTKVVKIK